MQGEGYCWAGASARHTEATEAQGKHGRCLSQPCHESGAAPSPPARPPGPRGVPAPPRARAPRRSACRARGSSCRSVSSSARSERSTPAPAAAPPSPSPLPAAPAPPSCGPSPRAGATWRRSGSSTGRCRCECGAVAARSGECGPAVRELLCAPHRGCEPQALSSCLLSAPLGRCCALGLLRGEGGTGLARPGAAGEGRAVAVGASPREWSRRAAACGASSQWLGGSAAVPGAGATRGPGPLASPGPRRCPRAVPPLPRRTRRSAASRGAAPPQRPAAQGAAVWATCARWWCLGKPRYSVCEASLQNRMNFGAMGPAGAGQCEKARKGWCLWGAWQYRWLSTR